jgi:hypothetical protein
MVAGTSPSAPGRPGSWRRSASPRVAVLRDDETLGFMLEGWAFNPGRSARQALDALAAHTRSATTLHLVMETALHFERKELRR